jgi:hypothetical protein
LLVYIIDLVTEGMSLNPDTSDNPLLQKDETFGRIMKRLEPFMATLSPEDKALMSETIMKCYLKYQKTIQSNTEGDYLMASLLMALLTMQNKRIEELRG